MRSMELNAQQQLRGAGAPAVTNIMLAAEQIRVDCVQLTTNGRYVVTGSIYGPPQVWDLKVGCRLVISTFYWRYVYIALVIVLCVRRCRRRRCRRRRL